MIVPGTQICIPPARRQAAGIISAMETLLRMRHHNYVSRRAFLYKWRKFRTALFLTPDYQQLRRNVLDAAGGKCEICVRREAVHIHHKIRVSMAPRLALVQSNCQAACRECHKEID